MTLFLDSPVDKSLSTTGAWTDIDLSSDIPAGATGAIFQVLNTSGSHCYFGVRKNGSSDNRCKKLRLNAQTFCLVGVDGNRVCEGKIDSTDVDFWLVGYTESDGIFFTDAYNKSLSTIDAWTDINLSNELPTGAVAAVFEIVNTSSSVERYGGLRKNGSTSGQIEYIYPDSHIFLIVGVDGNRVCEGKIEIANIEFYLLGYLIAGVAETNEVDRSLGSTGSYSDITETNAPVGASGAYVVCSTPSVYRDFAARKNGSIFDKYKRVPSRLGGIFVGLDANKKWEGKIGNLDVDFFTLGYFAGVVTKTKESSLGVRLVTQPTKASSLGLSVITQSTKQSSTGLILSGSITKESSLGICIEDTLTKASTLGLAIIKVITKESSLGLIIEETHIKESSLGLRGVDQLIIRRRSDLYCHQVQLFPVLWMKKESTLGLSIRDTITKTSSLGIYTKKVAEERGFYYAKLGSTILTGIRKDSFRITEELNKIPSFEFELANCSDNRTTITAGITEVFRIYRRINSVDTLMFTGTINGDGIEYLSLERIRITGYASYIDLNWRFHQHLDSLDAENVGKVYTYTGSYVDKTTEANNDTINDVPVTFDSVNDTLYIGQGEQFFGMQVKYSTPGVAADCFLRKRTGVGCQQIRFFPNCSGTSWATVVYEYSKGSGVWATLDVLDETRAFTEDAGTYFITIPHKPSDWAKDTVNSVKKFWIRARLSAGFYIDQPALDRIKITNIDVYRVYYFETAANAIMDDVLAGTDYSMDAVDVCPSDEISIVAEYETKLRFIAGIANALTWDDNGDKRAYQWWIDTNKKVHFKQKRGSTLGDITAELTILNNVKDYFNLSNRLHFLGNYDGLNQLRAVIENQDSQDTHEIRELAVPEERYNNYTPLKEAAQKAMTYTKAPLQKIAATVTTKYWLDNAFEVGDTVTLHKDTWNVDSTAFQIVRADIGPRVTNLDMGISQEHLDGLKAGLQRQLDISGIRMHGSTTLLQFGPETMNYQRVNDTTVYPSKLKIEIPSDVRYIHKVLLSWTIGPYRADVEPDTGSTLGHDHTGYTGSSSAHDHTGYTGAGGEVTPTELGEGEHTHTDAGYNTYSTLLGYLLSTKYTNYESSHTHVNYATDYESSHTHPKGRTGAPDDTGDAVISLNYGCDCSEACGGGQCVTGVNTDGWAEYTHWHLNTGLSTDGGTSHRHTQTATGSGSSHRHNYSLASGTAFEYVRHPITTYVVLDTDPDHTHTINLIVAHNNHLVASQAGESLTVATEPGESVTVEYGIHEIAAGTTLELLINSEVVASNYVGDQTDIRIDGYLSTGNNTVEIRPIVGENLKKGSCTTLAAGIFFIEAKKF